MQNLLKSYENRNNLYIIRDKHKKIIFISPIEFHNNTYNMENINTFYTLLFDSDRSPYHIEGLLSNIKDVIHTTYFFTSRHLLPVSVNLMLFTINKSKYYLEHYELVEDIDPLTLLPTRASLELTFDEYVYKNERFDLIFIDLDGFEQYNTKIGYVKTDYILQRIAQLMKTHFDPHEVFRYGGDEFIIVSLEKITDEQIEVFKQRIRKISMLENFDFSYGVSTYPLQEKLQDLVHKASEEMKIQKRSKKK